MGRRILDLSLSSRFTQRINQFELFNMKHLGALRTTFFHLRLTRKEHDGRLTKVDNYNLYTKINHP